MLILARVGRGCDAYLRWGLGRGLHLVERVYVVEMVLLRMAPMRMVDRETNVVKMVTSRKSPVSRCGLI